MSKYRMVECRICGVVESLNRRMVEWNGGVVESSNGSMVELSSCQMVECRCCGVLYLSNC